LPLATKNLPIILIGARMKEEVKKNIPLNK